MNPPTLAVLIVVGWIVLDVGIVIGWIMRVALTRGQGELR